MTASMPSPALGTGPEAAPIRVAVGIATAGRRDVLSETLRELTRQTRLPDLVVVCPAAAADVDEAVLGGLGVPGRVVRADKGLPKQRNAILAAIEADYDICVFIDDDFLTDARLIENVIALFAAHPEIVVGTGVLLGDGINGPGLSVDEGRAILARSASPAFAGATIIDAYGAYGCNMVVRLKPVLEHRVRFDETLPLYGWLEDIDFSRQMARYGTVRRTSAITGVHLGSKGGRTPGQRLGYSQVMNPVYLIRKGTVSPKFALNLVWRNIAANIVKSARPEPWADRRGRVVGNFKAIADVIRGRIDPNRILEL